MSCWTVDAVYAWVAATPCLGPDVAALLRNADIDGEALVSLTEDDTRALGIEPFGARRRLTLRVQGAIAAKHRVAAPPAAAAAPAKRADCGGAPPAAIGAGGMAVMSGGGAPPAAAAAPATGVDCGGAPPAATGAGQNTGGMAMGPRPPATPPPSVLVAAAGPRPPRMPPTWRTLHEDEDGGKGRKGRRKRGQGLAQAGAIGRASYPIGARPPAASSADEGDQPRFAEGPMGARSKKKAAPTFKRTKRGCRGGRKRTMPTQVTSELSSNEEEKDDVSRLA